MPRSSRSIRVAPHCLPKVRQALRLHGFPSQHALAIELGKGRSTINNFFRGEPVDFLNFVEISERLGLDWNAIAYIEEDPLIKVEPTPPSDPNGEPEKETIEWRQVCRAMLEAQNQRRLTTNPLTAGDGVTFELDEIYVPLGLVERKQRDRRSSDVSPEQGSHLYESEVKDEIVQTFQQDEFFEQVLRQGKSKRIAIIGEPGAGKTTLLQKIAAWVLDNTDDVPIWISLADLQGKSLKAYLLSDWLENATRTVQVSQEMQKDLSELFNSGRVWLLLDAVDEIAMRAQSLAPLQLSANQITGWVADARVVLTCRLNVWDAGKNALEAFETYRNLDFSYGDTQTPDQVGQFICRWFKDKPELAKHLRAELDQPGRERIKDAVKNPLRLALLCRAWSLGQGKLPDTKAGLYQKFTEALYEWKQERFPTSSAQRQELNKALGELALRAISEEKTKFRLRHCLICSVLGNPDTDLFQLALQLGWLNQVGVAAEAENRGEKVYAFFHPTFQEYLAAQAVKDWHYFLNHTPHDPTQGTYRIFEPQWKEVILLWLGREDVPKEQKENFIKALVEFEDECKDFYGYRAYFLAATGITEFGDCSKASEIVAQIVKWNFGYFNLEKQEWWTFIKPIKEGARATLPQTDRSRAIAELLRLIKSAEDEYTRIQAAESLGKIDAGNKDAITALVQLIEPTQDESTRRQAAFSLAQIGTGNQTAIAALVQLIKSTEDESTRRQATFSLGQIGSGNQTAIAALVQLIESTEDEFTRFQATESLEQIDPGNQTAITALVQLIEPTQKESIRWLATESLGQIGTGSQTASAALVQLIESTEDESTRWLAAESLGKIDSGNQTAISTLVQLIESTEDEFTRRQAAFSLEQIDLGNQTAIAALVQLIGSAKNESTRRQVAHRLGKIDPSNSEAVAALVQLIESAENESFRRKAAYSLGKIGTGNPETITALVQLIKSTENESTRWQAADSLGKINPGNPTAISTLVQLIESTEDESTRWQAAESLKKSLRDDQLVGIVTGLKDYLPDEAKENDFERFHQCHKVIWHCAQNLPYVAFYQTWHSQPTHIEVVETTAVGSNSFTRSLNLAELLQSLEAAIANDAALSQTIHLICIDSSKFIERDNPAAKIYAELVKRGCPKCEDGTPKTMSELQIYWDLLDTNKRVVLVFYEGTQGGAKGGVGFSETFLNALSKFDGTICIITAQTLDNLPLQCFSPNQAIAEVVDWLKKVTREA